MLTSGQNKAWLQGIIDNITSFSFYIHSKHAYSQSCTNFIAEHVQ